MPTKSDITASMQWDGQQIIVTVKKPLTQEQYDGMKVAPSMLAHLLLDKASDDLLMMRIPRVTIDEVSNEKL